MRKSQTDQRVARKQKERSDPACEPGFPERATFHEFLYRDESPSVGAHIRARPASGNPRIPPIFTGGPEARRTVFQARSPALIKPEGPPSPKEGRACQISAEDYFWIEATTPEPTVRPPSRIAKRRPSSMAIGAISLTWMVTLSPGITISVPSGRITSPVTSVVRK